MGLNNLLFARWIHREFGRTGSQVNTWPRLISHPQGNPLYHNAATGTIISNQSLVLQSVTRSRAGIYTCIGNNQEGDGESNPLNLDIKCEYPLYTFLRMSSAIIYIGALIKSADPSFAVT